MVAGLIGVKVGTSRLFNENGNSMLVTVVEAKPNLVCQVKTQDKDGYSAIQLAYGTQKPQRLSKALRGHYAKNKVPVARSLNEIRIDQQQEAEFNVGDQLSVTQFVAGQRVDATGVSKGKGFAGSVKRWNFSMQDATHGNSISHRHLGSTGQCQWPGKVWKGKKMAGQYGNKRSTSVRLKVAMVDEENNAIFITGAIPGAPGTQVIIKPAVKQTQEELAFVAKSIEELAKQTEVAEEQVADNPTVAEESVVADSDQTTQVEDKSPAVAKSTQEDDKELDASASKESKADDTAEEAKADDTAEEAKADDTAEEAKADDAGAEAKADDTAEEAKADDTAEEAKADDTAEELKADDTAEEAKADDAGAEEKPSPKESKDES